MNYWLLKSEPDTFGIEHLRAAGTTVWDGVRNYQARNFLRAAAVGDLALFYHSNAKPPGVAGLCRVIAAQVADPSQFDPNSKYFDPKSNPADPRWITVTVEYVETFPTFVSLDDLRERYDGDQLMVVRTGSRLSVTPVNASVAEEIIESGRTR